MISLSFFVLIEIIGCAALYHFNPNRISLYSLNNHQTFLMYPGIASNKSIPARKTEALHFKEKEEGMNIAGPTYTIPAVNIFESATEYLIVMATPGFGRENFNIEIDQSIITIAAKKETAPLSWVNDRLEYDYTEWTRAFTLPEDADEIMAHAHYQNGELVIHLPRNNNNENNAKAIIYVY